MAALEAKRLEATARKVRVFVGFQKNVSKYVRKIREYETSLKTGSFFTLWVSNNDYSSSSLGECFERNSEGLLKNMVIHELALLVTFYGVTVESISTVDVDEGFSSLQTLAGPSGQEFTDLDKVKFTILTKSGTKVGQVSGGACSHL